MTDLNILHDIELIRALQLIAEHIALDIWEELDQALSVNRFRDIVLILKSISIELIHPFTSLTYDFTNLNVRELVKKICNVELKADKVYEVLLLLKKVNIIKITESNPKSKNKYSLQTEKFIEKWFKYSGIADKLPTSKIELILEYMIERRIPEVTDK